MFNYPKHTVQLKRWLFSPGE